MENAPQEHTGDEASPANGVSVRRGRLLRLKLGYNPNSSSIGSYVFALPAALFGLTAAFGAVTALLHSVLIRPRASGEQPRASPSGGQQPKSAGLSPGPSR